MKKLVYVLHTMMPEQHNFASGDFLGPGEDQLYYIVKMSTG